MYRQRRFDLHLFDADHGYLQTTLADAERMPKDSPLIRLDAYGNAIWLETGYDL